MKHPGPKETEDAAETSTCRTSRSDRSAGREDRRRGQGRQARPRAGREDCGRGRGRHARTAGPPSSDLGCRQGPAPRQGAEMTWALATIAALLVGYATVSRQLERLNVSGAMFFTTTGLLVGPVLGLLDLHVHGEQVKLLAEITLTLVLFADASRISLRALRQESGVPLRLLGIGLPLTIIAGALICAAVIPGVSFAEALVLAIALACTDAALGQAVVSDERVPSRIRQGLNVESGLNDGLCVPLFFIAIAIAETDAGETSRGSAAQLVFEQIGYGLIGGVAAGALGGLALRYATRRRLIEPHWLQILS